MNRPNSLRAWFDAHDGRNGMVILSLEDERLLYAYIVQLENEAQTDGDLHVDEWGTPHKKEW